jgi:aldehyde dehydrogenase (NAD+)
MREMKSFYIDGEMRPPTGDKTRDMVSPSTGEVFGRIPVATTEDVNQAVAAARRAFDEGPWQTLAVQKRVDILMRAADILEPQINEIAEAQAYEIGTPLVAGRLIVGEAIRRIRAACRVALAAPQVEHRDGGSWTYQLRHEPVGVVAAIAPWNGGFFLTASKSSAALAAGCTVVDKPAVETPFSAMYFAKALAEAGIPNGVFNLIPADREVGEALISHPDVDMVSFTGSTAAGRKIAATCGQQLKKNVLELGGKSAAIVLEDADLSSVATAVASGTFFNSGQVCCALSRVLAPRSRYDEVVKILVEEAAKWPVGDPFNPTVTVGPLASARQRDRVEEYVRIGIEEGATLVVGGKRPDNPKHGFYVEPTVFRDVDNKMRIAQEEIFGPVVVVIPYDTEEEAIRIANDSEFGLHGAVFTANEQHALAVAARIRTGTFTINGFTMNQDAPLGGVKGSGIGTMNELEGLNEYRVYKTVNLRPAEKAFDTNLLRLVDAV